MSLIYLAIPYKGREYCSFRVSCEISAQLLLAGNNVLSPIAHSHMISLYGGLEKHAPSWYEYDIELLQRCDALAVVMLEGWKESKGVQMEIEEANRLGMPVIYLDPVWFVAEWTIQDWLRLDEEASAKAEVTM